MAHSPRTDRLRRSVGALRDPLKYQREPSSMSSNDLRAKESPMTPRTPAEMLVGSFSLRSKHRMYSH